MHKDSYPFTKNGKILVLYVEHMPYKTEEDLNWFSDSRVCMNYVADALDEEILSRNLTPGT